MRKSPASEWISVPEAARLKGVTDLAAGGSDEAIRQRILQLRGGAEALKRLARIDEGQRRFAGLGVSTEEYLRWKREEIELEQRRDAARDA